MKERREPRPRNRKRIAMLSDFGRHIGFVWFSARSQVTPVRHLARSCPSKPASRAYGIRARLRKGQAVSGEPAVTHLTTWREPAICVVTL